MRDTGSHVRLVALVAFCAALLTACGGDEGEERRPPTDDDSTALLDFSASFDPAAGGWLESTADDHGRTEHGRAARHGLLVRAERERC